MGVDKAQNNIEDMTESDLIKAIMQNLQPSNGPVIDLLYFYPAEDNPTEIRMAWYDWYTSVEDDWETSRDDIKEEVTFTIGDYMPKEMPLTYSIYDPHLQQLIFLCTDCDLPDHDWKSVFEQRNLVVSVADCDVGSHNEFRRFVDERFEQ